MRAPARWPGPDGVFALLFGLMVAVSWLLGPSEGLGPQVAVALAAVAAWIVVTRPERPALPPAAPDVRPLVVIPTHGNGGTIDDIVTRCRAVHPDVLVVDDGSPDDSAARAEAAGAVVVRHEVNRGKGAALQTALHHAAAHGFSHIVAIDADGQHFPEDLPAFLEAMRAHPDAVHAGVRDMSEAPGGAVGARANSNFWVWVETGRRLGDTQCGFRVYPVISTLALGLPPSRYQWEVEVLVRAVWSGLPVREVPCKVYYPPKGERVSSYRKVVDTLRVTWLNTWLVGERLLWPPRWFPGVARTDWRGQHRGTLWGWELLRWALRVLGRRVVSAVVVPLAAFYWAVAAPFRRGVDAYLRRRFPDAGPLRRSWYALRVMIEFAWSLVDRFTLLVHGPDALPFDRAEAVHLRETLHEERKGVLLLSAHLGNPELASVVLRGGPARRRVNVVMHVSEGDPYVALLRSSSDDLAPRIIALNDPENPAPVAILQALRRDEVVALKVDRVVDDKVTEVPFLGDPILLPTGPMLLAGLSEAQVVLVSCFRQRGGAYRLEATHPRTYRFRNRATRGADVARWTTDLARVLESWTARYPLQWFNFHDPWAHPGRRGAAPRR